MGKSDATVLSECSLPQPSGAGRPVSTQEIPTEASGEVLLVERCPHSASAGMHVMVHV